MAKRKAGVNDIIYELDNDDIELSSDDEGKETKIGRFELGIPKKQHQNTHIRNEKYTEVINLDCSSDGPCDTLSPNYSRNGGKTTRTNESQNNFYKNDGKLKITNKPFQNNTMVFHEHSIAVDSPTSISDLGVVGCENRTPLVTVRFRDRKLAHTYKQKVREFLINLLKSQKDDSVSLSGESDVELDIWPEELFAEEFDNVEEVDEELDKTLVVDEEFEDFEDDLFFVDTEPCDDSHTEIPKYSQTSSIISNISEEKDTPAPAFRRGPTCFNCDGTHQLKDCPLPRNHNRIAAKRKTVAPRVGRYHVEDEQKYGHLIPGRISGNLRHALGLKRNELPLHIYRMRLLGYPPGWIEEARISHSGITLFDSTGNATQDPEEEDGELCEPGSKDKFDIKKILDFPGFNVPASSRYVEESHLFGLPSMSEQDSKLGMLQALAPNAMMAYKRKKLTFFPSASQKASQEGQAEMDLDSGDEIAEFPSMPPLPDEEPPSAPPPPPTPPPDDEPEISDKSDLPSKDKISNDHKQPVDINVNNKEFSKTEAINSDKEKENLNIDKNMDNNEIDLASSSDDELEVIEVVQVPDIPVPEDDLITIDEVDDKSPLSSGRDSPSLDALEERKKRLLDALKGGDVTLSSADFDENLSDFSENIENITDSNDQTLEEKNSTNTIIDLSNSLTVEIDNDSPLIDEDVKTPDENISESQVNIQVDNESSTAETEVNITPGTKVQDPVKYIEVDNGSSNTKVDVVTAPETKTQCQEKNPKIDESANEPDAKTKQLKNNQAGKESSTTKVDIVNTPDQVKNCKASSAVNEKSAKELDTKTSEVKNNQVDKRPSTAKEVNTPDTKTQGHVKNTSYGTPVLNVASPFVKLPSDDKFAKDICDVLNFENLPNSTGKYKKISSLLKRVKSAVDRIQDS